MGDVVEEAMTHVGVGNFRGACEEFITARVQGPREEATRVRRECDLRQDIGSDFRPNHVFDPSIEGRYIAAGLDASALLVGERDPRPADQPQQRVAQSLDFAKKSRDCATRCCG